MENIISTIYSILQNIIIGLPAFAIIIIIHELGHMLCGISVGIKVKEFGIFMGKTIYSFEYKNILFKIGCIPIGGYCQYKGDSGLEATSEAEKNIIKDEKEDKDSFHTAHPLKKIFAVLGGPLFNIISAIFISIFLSYSKTEYIVPNTNIIVTSKYGSSTLKTGDFIQSINNEKVSSFNDIIRKLYTNHDLGKQYSIEIIRNNKKNNILYNPTNFNDPNSMHLHRTDEIGLPQYITSKFNPKLLKNAYINLIQSSISINSQEEKINKIYSDKFDIKSGNNNTKLFLEINNNPIYDIHTFLQYKEKPINHIKYLEIITNNDEKLKSGYKIQSINNIKLDKYDSLEKSLKLESNKLSKSSGKNFTCVIKYNSNNKLKLKEYKGILYNWYIDNSQFNSDSIERFNNNKLILSNYDATIIPGIIKDIKKINIGITDAIIKGTYDVYHFSIQHIKNMKKLFSMNATQIRKTVSGPIGIIKIISSSSKNIMEYLRIIMILSIVIAIFNLLPIPPLDGSHIVSHTLELVIGRNINTEKINIVGIILMILISIMVLFNDILKIFY